ncbi:hypothetical protein Tco_0319552 [Tanacetum coccineum]
MDFETPIPTFADINVTNLDEATQVSIATARSLEDLEARENVKKVEENLVDEEIKKIVEGSDNVDEDEFMDKTINSQEDPDTMLEPRSHKERPEVDKSVDVLIINDDEEEESAGDALIRKKRKGVVEIKDTPPPTPIRSPRTHTTPLFSDKEKLQELTASDPTPLSSKPTTSSLKPKPIRVKQYKTITKGVHTTLKKVVPKMVDHNTNDFTKNNLPRAVAEEIRPNIVPLQVDSFLRDYMLNHILHVHPTLFASSSIPDLQHQLYLKMKDDEQAQQADISIFVVVRRDHEHHHDDDARPEGESSAKIQRIFELGKYTMGESSSSQVINESTPFGSGTQEEMEDF